MDPNDPGLYRRVLALAPMAEITHSAFRRLTEGFSGCDIYHTEMLSVGALLNVSPYEKYYTDLDPVPERTMIQLVGEDPDYFQQAVEKLMADKEGKFMGFDVNMGCSISVIRKKGWGVELMEQPEKVQRILRNIRSAAPDKRLSVKIRLGAKEDWDTLSDFCKMLIDEGVESISLNPKTKKEGRNRPGRWSWVHRLEKELPVPVFGNSDIINWESFLVRRKVVEGVGTNSGKFTGYMIGRGAVISPWIFQLIKGRLLDPDFRITVDLLKTAQDFILNLKKYQPEDFYLSRAKRFFFYYSENMQFGHKLRYEIQNASSLQEIEIFVSSYFLRNPNEQIKIY